MSRTCRNLSNGPLALVLAQIRFTPVVQISDYVPKVQDRLRKNGFPLFNTIQGESFQPKPHGGLDRFPLVQWIFSSEDYNQNIIVNSEQLVYQVFDTQTYSYDEYFKRLLMILKLFDEVVDLSSFTRFGLRYINSIPENNESSWKTYVSKSFHKISFPDNHEWLDNTLNTFIMQRGVNLKQLGMKSNFLLRIYQQTDKRKYPADILRIVPEVRDSSEFFEQASMVTFLDLDHFVLVKSTSKGEMFDKIPLLFDELHGTIEDVFFETMITKEAAEKWK